MLPSLESKRTVLAVQRRNMTVDPSVRYDLQREFEDVAAVANAQDGEVDLLGQSSGAICALGASLLIPGLRRLVLYEPPLMAMTESNIDQMQAKLGSGDVSGAAESFLLDSVKLAPETIASMKASPGWAQTMQRAPYMIREEAVLRASPPEPRQFAELMAPVLLLVGALTPVGHHHRGYVDLLSPWVRSLQVREIAGQEHAAHSAAPALFAEILLEFLESEV
jgi:pimeloyl-ACP methyl ester carboxylesterase